jgi:hypothetical protein
MDKRIVAIVAGAVGLLLLGYAIFFWDNDEDLIREKLDQLTLSLHVTKGEVQNPAIAGVHLKSEFAEIFTQTVLVTIPELKGSGGGALPRADLAMFAGQMKGRFQAATVSLGDISVQIQDETAHVDATATLIAEDFGGAPRRDIRDVDFEFQKIEGEWQIAGLTVGAAQSGSPFPF